MDLGRELGSEQAQMLADLGGKAFDVSWGGGDAEGNVEYVSEGGGGVN